jgi:hypothetical protein
MKFSALAFRRYQANWLEVFAQHREVGRIQIPKWAFSSERINFEGFISNAGALSHSLLNCAYLTVDERIACECTQRDQKRKCRAWLPIRPIERFVMAPCSSREESVGNEVDTEGCLRRSIDRVGIPKGSLAYSDGRRGEEADGHGGELGINIDNIDSVRLGKGTESGSSCSEQYKGSTCGSDRPGNERATSVPAGADGVLQRKTKRPRLRLESWDVS